MINDKILVIGASGLIGKEIVRELKSKGLTVYESTSRIPEHDLQVQINLDTGNGLKSALSKVDRLFLLSPAGFADQHRILSPVVREAKMQKLKKVVLMTAFGADADETSPFRRLEVELENSGLQFNILRPNWFMQNFNTFWKQGILDEQKIMLPAGNAKTSFIDSRDVSAVAARLLIDDSLKNTNFDLTGPDALTHEDIAKEISNQIGTRVTYSDIDPADLKSELISAGLPEDYVNFLVLIFGFLREGYNSGVTDNVEKILGFKPRSFKDYANDYKQYWN